ncbi:MAG: DNA polymerase III subunit gamma and tau [Propionibacteriaceae bacterium]|nr:DNA polymerase III subunit gamma and tau [Propionibacteriaceae bacterium]
MAEEQLALYRRYRPDTFAEVIGQEHVTEPLQRALANNKVTHAYLFSGPRGCGKTTSARILARCLNCEKGPAPEPCGECDSCKDLARGGPGSIDVIEIDAASHGGVDDARDLRERAFFAPVRSRYKIYIIDEAHMVTKEGFNALLKVVEEPPEHVKFIFATTEPEKVIGTIKSRTHHYPFRLVPPRILQDYLAQVCESEGVKVEPLVLPLVVRAGAGSVRDALSVLDQLLGGAEDGGVSYLQATALLGYTPDTLLDEMVEAFGARDAAQVFATVDHVIEAGLDPRRFAEDLLHRLRDLILVKAVPDATSNGLVDVAADQAERLKLQITMLSPAELTRAAEVVATGLGQMRGTTTPRLHLELMCARVLLPGATNDESGLAARLGRLEARAAAMPSPTAQPPSANTAVAVMDSRPPAENDGEKETQPPAAPAPPTPSSSSEARGSRRLSSGESELAHSHATIESEGRSLNSERRAEALGANTERASGASTITAAEIRRHWVTILDAVQRQRRVTYMILSQSAHILSVQGNVLTLGIRHEGTLKNFVAGGHQEVFIQAIADTLGVTLGVDAVFSDGPAEAAPRPTSAPTSAPVSASAPAPEAAPAPSAPPVPEPAAEAAPSVDDVTIDSTDNLDTEELLSRELGAILIEEDE